MKNTLLNVAYFLVLLLLFQSCNDSEHSLIPNSSDSGTSDEPNPRNLSDEFKEYWYDGTAEITSYRLSQQSYGELRDGTMVTIFVTEDFDPEQQLKAEKASDKSISVMKLNATKKFLTGIYPYSIMTSTFSPVAVQNHALKITTSVQEWCGQVFIQLNNRDAFEVMSRSYFENTGDLDLKLDKGWLEDELWNLIRINPESLPTGELKVVPSFESIRLRHKEIKAYNVLASLKQGDSITTYQLKYPELQREVTVYFNSTFPFGIEKWEETNAGGVGDTTELKTTAVRMKRIKSEYWNKNAVKDVFLRDSLNLKY